MAGFIARKNVQFGAAAAFLVVAGFYVQGWYGDRARSRAGLEKAWNEYASCAYGPALGEGETPKARIRSVELGSGQERLGKCPWVALGRAAWSARDGRSAHIRDYLVTQGVNPAERSDNDWPDRLWNIAREDGLTTSPSMKELYPPKRAELLRWASLPTMTRRAPFDVRHAGATTLLVSERQAQVCDFAPELGCRALPDLDGRALNTVNPVDRETSDVLPAVRSFAEVSKTVSNEIVDLRTNKLLGTTPTTVGLRATNDGVDAIVEEVQKGKTDRFARKFRLDRIRSDKKTLSHPLPPAGVPPVFVGPWIVYGAPKAQALSASVKGFAIALPSDGALPAAPVAIGDLGPLDATKACVSGDFAAVAFPSGVSPVTRGMVAVSKGGRWKTFPVDKLPIRGTPSCEGDTYRLGWLSRATNDGEGAGEVVCTIEGCTVRTRKTLDFGDNPRFALVGSTWIVVFEREKAIRFRVSSWETLDSNERDRAVLDLLEKDAIASLPPDVFAAGDRAFAIWTGQPQKDAGTVYGFSFDRKGAATPITWPAIAKAK